MFNEIIFKITRWFKKHFRRERVQQQKVLPEAPRPKHRPTREGRARTKGAFGSSIWLRTRKRRKARKEYPAMKVTKEIMIENRRRRRRIRKLIAAA